MNKIDKLTKKLGIDTIQDLGKLDKAAMQSRIVQAEQAMQQAHDELEANPNYQELKENLKALMAGKREVNSRQRAVIEYCLYLMEEEK